MYRDEQSTTNFSTYVELIDVSFPGDEMVPGWYTGEYPLEELVMRSRTLQRIHANVFDHPALHSLDYLSMRHLCPKVIYMNGVLNGLTKIKLFKIQAQSYAILPPRLLEPVTFTMIQLRLHGWAGIHSFDEMFADQTFSNLLAMQVTDIRLPMLAFRLLAATNFTAFPKLHDLRLIGCGIEVIDENAFDRVGFTLKFLDLSDNPIKYFTFPMFRRMLESKPYTSSLGGNDLRLICTCRLIELELFECPLVWDLKNTCLICEKTNGFDENLCGIKRHVTDLRKYGIRSRKAALRYVGIQMVYTDGFLSIQTNFTSKIRMLFVNMATMMMNTTHCSAIAARQNYYRCLNLDKRTNHFDLGVIEELRHADLLSITAIPILHAFAARYAHIMTVRLAIDHRHHYDFTLISLVMTAVVGFIAGLCAAFVWNLMGQARKNRSETSVESAAKEGDGNECIEN